MQDPERTSSEVLDLLPVIHAEIRNLAIAKHFLRSPPKLPTSEALADRTIDVPSLANPKAARYFAFLGLLTRAEVWPDQFVQRRRDLAHSLSNSSVDLEPLRCEFFMISRRSTTRKIGAVCARAARDALQRSRGTIREVGRRIVAALSEGAAKVRDAAFKMFADQLGVERIRRTLGCTEAEMSELLMSYRRQRTGER
jgi:hypothetical protein